MNEGKVENTNCEAIAGVTVIFELLATATLAIVAPKVTEPAEAPVKFAVYTPVLGLVTESNKPVPPTALEVNAIELRAGKPEGSEFPYASFAVRVAVIDDPEVTLEFETVTTLCAVE